MPPKADKLLFSLAPIMAMGMVFTLVAHDPLRRHDLPARVHGRRWPNIFAGPGGAALRHVLGRPEERLLPDRSDGRAARRRHPLRLRDVGAGDHRRGHRRLVERQQVQPDGRRSAPPARWSSYEVDAGDVAHRRDDDLRHRAPRRHGALAGGARLGHLRPAARVLPLLHRRGRREQAHPVRPAGGRERARVRVLHRVRRDEVRDVLLRRVHGGRHRARCCS